MIFKINRIDEKFEPYEFMLVWDGQKGEQFYWLFLDFENKLRVSNLQTKNRKQLLKKYDKDITIVAEAIEPKFRQMFNDLMLAKNAYRLFKDGEIYPVNVKNMNINYKESDQLLDIQCTVNYDSRS